MSVLVGRPAPDFTAAAVLGDGKIVGDYNFAKATRGKYAVIMFYPLDFTFVCPSELIALDAQMECFKKLNVEVLSVSIDSQFTHNAWRNTAVNDGGIGPVQYTMVADVKHSITQAYGVEHPDAGVAFRATFIVDKKGMVRSEIVNDLPLGRNIEEFVRLVEALQYVDEHGEVCPANWTKNKEAMTPTPEGVAAYLKKNAKSL
jgi:peroxiredoxin (alkyl hydroperoxide reductase subunit C)